MPTKPPIDQSSIHLNGSQAHQVFVLVPIHVPVIGALLLQCQPEEEATKGQQKHSSANGFYHPLVMKKVLKYIPNHGNMGLSILFEPLSQENVCNEDED